MRSPQSPVCGRTRTDLFFASSLAFIVAHQFREAVVAVAVTVVGAAMAISLEAATNIII